MNTPLQSKKCMNLINTLLKKNQILLEVGSGYSTIDFSYKVKVNAPVFIKFSNNFK